MPRDRGGCGGCLGGSVSRFDSGGRSGVCHILFCSSIASSLFPPSSPFTAYYSSLTFGVIVNFVPLCSTLCGITEVGKCESRVCISRTVIQVPLPFLLFLVLCVIPVELKSCSGLALQHGRPELALRQVVIHPCL